MQEWRLKNENQFSFSKEKLLTAGFCRLSFHCRN